MIVRFLALQAVLVLLLPSLAAAQDDLSILTTSVPPKVVLLLDTSGSMKIALPHDGFNQVSVQWRFNDRFPKRLFDDDDSKYCNFGTVPEVAGSNPLCPGSQHGTDDRCPQNEFFPFGNGGSTYTCRNIPGNCAKKPIGWGCTSGGGNVNLTPPNFGTNYTTWYQVNYMHWLVQEMHKGNQYTVPLTDRMTAAKIALKGLINGVNPPGLPETVHFGLARFNLSGNGGTVLVPAIEASRAAIFAALDTASTGATSTFPNGGTPASEALVDVGRYFVGSNGLGSYPDYSYNDNTGSVPGSPLDETCRAAYTVVVTDGAPSSDLNDHFGTAFTDTIGNADGDDNENPNPWNGRTPQNFVPPYQSTGSDWLDDVAYYLAQNDLIDDAVLDEDQHVITYTVGFAIDHPLLQETATNGNGAYFTTSNATQLQTDLKSALNAIIERSSSLTSATVPASRSAYGDGFYTAFFIPSTGNPFWEGHLQAYRLTNDLQVVDKFGNAALDPNTNLFKEPRFPFWDAGDVLADANHPARNLHYTGAGVLKTFNTTNISSSDLGLIAADLTAYPNDPNVPFGSLNALRDAIINYMIGQDRFDRDRDGNTTEKRDAVLGDIFHSNPISVGPPPSSLSDEEGYGPSTTAGTFLYQFKARDRRIFAGANDGFLHAFNGGSLVLDPNGSYYDLGTGQEVFGYVPGFLVDKLKIIPRNVPRTNYYVDGNPSAADIWVPADASDVSKSGDEWTTLLVTGMRQGGAGYLALDVTDPTGAAPHGPYPKLMWEFDDTSEPLGDTWSEPIITRIKMKAGSGVGDNCGRDLSDDGDCREQWVVIVGGGYKANGDPNLTTYLDPNDPGWSAESRAVFMLKADTGEVLAKLAYDAVDTTFSRMKYSIPSTAGVLDLNADGLADVAYIGDLGGQLWKWDISAVGEDLDVDGLVDDGIWPAGIFFSSAPANVGDTDLDGYDNYHYRSIFFPPIATYVSNKLLLAFGSGERTNLAYEGVADPNDPLLGLHDDNNRFWVVWDRVPTGTGALDVELGEGYQTIAGLTRGINDITSLTSDPAPDDDGYYIVVPDGEKFVVNNIVFGGFTLALTYMPDNSGLDICDGLGETNIYLFGIKDGSGALDDGGTPTRSLKLGNGAPTDPRVAVSRDSNGNMIVELVGQTSTGEVLKLPIPADPPPPFGSVYWRQRF